MEKHDVIKTILRNTDHGRFFNKSGGSAWAPSNVALCKYWGKRNTALNLPTTSSLSISLGNKGAFTKIKHEDGVDSYTVNGKPIEATSVFYQRLQKFLCLFRPKKINYSVNIETNVPIACGFASSACGFASLVQALNQLYDWRLAKKELSILARLGSGSACRSLFDGFVEWQKGENDDGMDSYSTRLDYTWPELRIGALYISTKEKSVSSTEAMQRTVNTSLAYKSWPKQIEQDLATIKLALEKKDFILLGQTAENNSQAMHALIKSSQPPINYNLPITIEAMSKVQKLRLNNIPVFFTQDAGSNLQLLFLSEHEPIILKTFTNMNVIKPFVDNKNKHIILVDENDSEIGISEKLTAHQQEKLHRAFSTFVIRQNKGVIEILLQQRSSNKYHSANLWSNSCCGHPQPNENIKAAAERRLREEIGLDITLQEIGKFHYTEKFPNINLTENEIDHVFIGFSNFEAIKINTAEVQNYRWLDIPKIQNDLKQNPQNYTVWLQSALDLLLQFQPIVRK